MIKVQPDFYAGDTISVPVIIQDGTGTPIPIGATDTIKAAFVKVSSYSYTALHTAKTLDLSATGSDLPNGKVIFELTPTESATISAGYACVMLKSTELGRHILSKEEYLIATGIIS